MLRQKGWINFRMRAMLMSTASYLLWLHWRETGLHLAREFVDYEPGIHWPQVQMQSGSTGINTLRIYNPIKQALDQDPHGKFVRQWIPALRRVPNAWLFEPHLMPANLQLQYGCVLEKDYPLPLVDIKQAMRYAKSQISLARKNNLNQQETSGVLHKHGSRRSVKKKRGIKKVPQQSSLF
jgi:deoxyribodipyrimidine photo-lyase